MGSVYLVNAFACLAWAILHPGRNGYEETRQSFIRQGYTGETDERGGFLLKVRCEKCRRRGWCAECQRAAWTKREAQS